LGLYFYGIAGMCSGQGADWMYENRNPAVKMRLNELFKIDYLKSDPKVAF
jgi:hypothetical protein